MYLLINKEDKIVLNTVDELQKYNLNNYKVYVLVLADPSDLVSDGQIRDGIAFILKGKEMTKHDLIEQAAEYLNIQKTKVSKILTKMIKEGSVFYLDDFDYMGNRILGMDQYDVI